MHRPNLLTFLFPGVRRAVPTVAGLALLVAVVPAGSASAASGGCTTSGNQVTCIFTFPQSPQTWTVPAGVSQATFTLYGAEGGKASTGETGGLGAAVTGTLPVTAGTVLQLNLGQAGGTSSGATIGGGGGGGEGGGGGGGATDVRTPAADGTYPLANRLLVAGGGGGAGATDPRAGNGSGGGGGNADSPGGTGQSADDSGATLGGGGGGGAGTTAGPGLGGDGGTVTGTSTSSCSFTTPGSPGGDGGTGASQGTGGTGAAQGPGGTGGGGGGGGGGYYGGGGGGGFAIDQGCVVQAGGGGGGGGASYTGGVGGAVITDGVAAPDNAPDGEVIIAYTVPVTATSTAVTSSANPSVVGQPVTFTATVSSNPPGAGTPTGTVTFSDGGSPIGTATLDSSGTATITTSSLAAGAHTITASYGGDNNFSGSTGSLTQTVNQPVTATATAVTSSANPSVVGQPVTFTATVSSNPPGAWLTPTGTVTFSDGGSPIGTATLDSSGTATITTSSLAAGAHTITASYGGDNNFSGSTGSLTQTVNKAATATALSSSANPSVVGQPVTFTATVSANPPGAGTPTGTVTFSDGGSPIGTATLNGSGKATITTSSLAAGAHTITASYGGDNNFSGSTGSLTQTVNKAATATALSSSANPSVVGQPVTFTATVSASPPGAGTPTGTVTFSDGGSPIGTATLNGSGKATITTSSLAAGAHTITASYGGDNNFSGSTGSLTQTVNKAATATALSSSANPSVIGGQVTYTATVSPVPDGGTVAFTDGGTPIAGCGAVKVSTSTGTATCQVTYPATGRHTITAAYSGDALFAASTSAALTQQVAYAVKLLYNTTKASRSGATVKITLQLLNAAGANVSATGTVVTVTGLSPSPAPGTPPSGSFTFLTRGSAAPGYEKDVKTAGYPAGTYTLSFTAGSDPTTHTAPFVIS